MIKNKGWIVKLVISILILVILIKEVGVLGIIHTLSNLNPIFIIPITAFHILTLILGAINLQILLKGVNKVVSFSDILKKYLVSSIIGAITPGRLGDFSMVYFLKKIEVPIGTSIAIILLDKVLTIITLMIFSVWSLFLFESDDVAIAVVVGSIAVLLMLWFMFISETGKYFIKKILLRSFSYKIEGFSKTLGELLREKKGYVLGNIGITIIKWLLHFVLFYVTFWAFEVKLPLFSLLLFATVMLIAYIPITLGGLGLREVAAVYLFKFVGIEPEIVISVFLLILIIKYASNLAIILYLTKE